MKTIEELEAAWLEACAVRQAAWGAAANGDNEAFEIYREAVDAAADAFDALFAAREAAFATPQGGA